MINKNSSNLNDLRASYKEMLNEIYSITNFMQSQYEQEKQKKKIFSKINLNKKALYNIGTMFCCAIIAYYLGIFNASLYLLLPISTILASFRLCLLCKENIYNLIPTHKRAFKKYKEVLYYKLQNQYKGFLKLQKQHKQFLTKYFSLSIEQFSSKSKTYDTEEIKNAEHLKNTAHLTTIAKMETVTILLEFLKKELFLHFKNKLKLNHKNFKKDYLFITACLKNIHEDYILLDKKVTTDHTTDSLEYIDSFSSAAKKIFNLNVKKTSATKKNPRLTFKKTKNKNFRPIQYASIKYIYKHYFNIDFMALKLQKEKILVKRKEDLTDSFEENKTDEHFNQSYLRHISNDNPKNEVSIISNSNNTTSHTREKNSKKFIFKS